MYPIQCTMCMQRCTPNAILPMEVLWTGNSLHNMWTNGVILTKHSSLDGIAHYSPQLRAIKFACVKGLAIARKYTILKTKLNGLYYVAYTQSMLNI